MDDFRSKVATFEEASAKLAAAAATNDLAQIRNELNNVGRNACGACHREYRAR